MIESEAPVCCGVSCSGKMFDWEANADTLSRNRAAAFRPEAVAAPSTLARTVPSGARNRSVSTPGRAAAQI
ncbi:MAG: hypothetical protein ACLTTU_16625, partial [Bilophila wadsworthia]